MHINHQPALERGDGPVVSPADLLASFLVTVVYIQLVMAESFVCFLFGCARRCFCKQLYLLHTNCYILCSHPARFKQKFLCSSLLLVVELKYVMCALVQKTHS